jgi:hypothetical protein
MTLRHPVINILFEFINPLGQWRSFLPLQVRGAVIVNGKLTILWKTLVNRFCGFCKLLA